MFLWSLLTCFLFNTLCFPLFASSFESNQTSGSFDISIPDEPRLTVFLKALCFFGLSSLVFFSLFLFFPLKVMKVFATCKNDCLCIVFRFMVMTALQDKTYCGDN